MRICILLPKPARSAYKNYFLILLSILILAVSQNISAQAFNQLIEANHGAIGNIPAVPEPTIVGGSSVSAKGLTKGSVPSVASSPGAALATGIMQMMLTKMLSPDPKQQQAEEAAKQAELDRIAAEAAKQAQIEAALEQERYENMMKLYKPVPGSQTLEVKTPDGNADLDFKTLNGDAEQMASEARRPFDSAGELTEIPDIGEGTDFFGVPVSSPEFTTLTDPDSDPVIADLDEANKYINENVAKEEIEKVESLKKDDPGEVKKELPEGYCVGLQTKLSGFTETRAKFQKTINLTQGELNKWKEQNNAAMWNAAKSGFSLVTDIFLKHLDLRKTGATDLKKYLEALPLGKTPGAADNYIKILDQVINYRYNLPKTAENIKKATEYAFLLRDATQIMAEEIAKSDQDVSAMLNDPRFKVLLNDGNPEVDAGQFSFGKIADIFLEGPKLQEKLISAFTKTQPIVAWCQFAVDQTYNATDWILSYKRICDLNNVSGKETEAAQYLQTKIFETRLLMKDCPD